MIAFLCNMSCNKRKIKSSVLNYNGLYYQEKLILNARLKE